MTISTIDILQLFGERLCHSRSRIMKRTKCWLWSIGLRQQRRYTRRNGPRLLNFIQKCRSSLYALEEFTPHDAYIFSQVLRFLFDAQLRWRQGNSLQYSLPLSSVGLAAHVSLSFDAIWRSSSDTSAATYSARGADVDAHLGQGWLRFAGFLWPKWSTSLTVSRVGRMLLLARNRLKLYIKTIFRDSPCASYFAASAHADRITSRHRRHDVCIRYALPGWWWWYRTPHITRNEMPRLPLMRRLRAHSAGTPSLCRGVIDIGDAAIEMNDAFTGQEAIWEDMSSAEFISSRTSKSDSISILSFHGASFLRRRHILVMI